MSRLLRLLVAVVALLAPTWAHKGNKPGDWCQFGDAIDLTGININREYISAGTNVPVQRSMTIEAWIWAPDPDAKEWKT